MKNLYIDPDTNDITLSNYNLRVTTTITEFLSQKIENVLKTISGLIPAISGNFFL